MKIEDTVHITLSKEDLELLICEYFKATRSIVVVKTELVINPVPKGEYNVYDLVEVRCEGGRV